ncbi:hypothetical protein IM792_10885 [Mucilaginibacter sp. JRF]|uniref:hypothetical protein n=1 Tax=Mucilaginibacter sp. JRF TaxID=2780088 RepID=UPI001880B63E|nr:hypothetical protein [Mucilaginibacter sp. JRF]MBE9584954.1 hypothetical protein [Mucilaginibacter sp. JRF]
MSDDKREAVNIGINLSGQLITAALAMIAVIGTFGVFILDKRDVSFWYYLIFGGALFAFVASIYFGGKGIDKARKDGFAGTWDILNTKTHFNRQAACCFIGIFLFILSVFSGTEKPDDLQKEISKVKDAVTRLQLNDSLNKQKVSSLEKRIDSLEKKPSQFIPCFPVKKNYCKRPMMPTTNGRPVSRKQPNG